MNGIENIIARIGHDAEQEAAAIESSAKAQAEAALADCRARAEAEAEAVLAKGREQAALKEERLVNAARLEGKKKTLAPNQTLVDEAFARALELLKDLTADHNTALLSRLAAQASATGREQVILSPADREACGKQVVEQANALLKGGGLTLSGETRGMAGGVILKDEKIETNCSFEALLHLRRDDLTADVAKVLFG